MTVSVAMCTYNGALYIEEQLRSILAQTVPVNEIVICDDGSTDTTIDILHRVQQSTTTPITIYVNEQHLGVNLNFEKAIKHCSGDIIFLSDQDDIWEENKVEVIKHYFSTHNDKTVVFGDAVLIDRVGQVIENYGDEMRLWEYAGFSKRAQKQFNQGFGLELWAQMNRATGATMAFRKSIVSQVQFDRTDMFHDAILSLQAMATNSLGYITQPLIRYRLHEHNTAGCNLEAPKIESWDDARFAGLPWADVTTFPWNSNRQFRLAFLEHRYYTKWTFMGWKIYVMLPKYIKAYGKHFPSFVSYDMKNAWVHSIERIRKKKLSKLLR